MKYRVIKVRLWGAENDPKRELIVEGPLDGSLYWLDLLHPSEYPNIEVISKEIEKNYLVD